MRMASRYLATVPPRDPRRPRPFKKIDDAIVRQRLVGILATDQSGGMRERQPTPNDTTTARRAVPASGRGEEVFQLEDAGAAWRC